MKKLFILFISLSAFSTYAQETWTLQQCLEYSETHNSQFQKIKNASLISEQNILQAKGAMLPTINASASQNYNFGRSIDPFTNVYLNQQVRSNNFNVNGSLVLFNGFLLQNSLRQSKDDVAAAQQDIDQYRLDLSISIVQAYVSILMNEEIWTNAKLQAETTKGVYERTDKLKESGVVAKSSALDVYAQWKTEEANVIQTKNNLDLSYLNLGLLLELTDPMSIRIVKPAQNLEKNQLSYASPQAVMDVVIEQIPQLKSLEYKKLSATHAYYANKGRYYPRLTLNGSLGTLYSTSGKYVSGQQYNGTQVIGITENTNENVLANYYTNIYSDKPFNTQIKDNYSKFIGVTLSIPIVNGLQVRTTVHRNKIAMTQADLDYNIARISLQRTIYTAYYQASGSQSKLSALYESYNATQESFRNAEKRFDGGLITSVEFNQMKNTLNQSQSNLVQAKYDFIFKNAILEIYSGQPVNIQ
ncbi:TolC family protein [Cytophaga aurantiaca]|uniref:TolC family protein n=1 Tax=Cytophaga aurantiaca TaxID=29530 RepID=UPI0003781EB8|nr:TolC family protein [Cytophaga aurantiaca]